VPKIPSYNAGGSLTREAPLPRISETPNIGAGLQQLGGGISDVGNTLAVINERFRIAKANQEINRVTNEANKLWTDTYLQAKEDPTLKILDTYYKPFEEKLNSLGATLTEPEAQNQWQVEQSKLLDASRLKLTERERYNLISHAEADRITAQEIYRQAYYSGTLPFGNDEQNKAEVVNRYSDMVKRDFANGLIKNKADAVQERELFIKNLNEGKFYSDYGKLEPIEVKAKLDAGEYVFADPKEEEQANVLIDRRVKQWQEDMKDTAEAELVDVQTYIMKQEGETGEYLAKERADTLKLVEQRRKDKLISPEKAQSLSKWLQKPPTIKEPDEDSKSKKLNLLVADKKALVRKERSIRPSNKATKKEQFEFRDNVFNAIDEKYITQKEGYDLLDQTDQSFFQKPDVIHALTNLEAFSKIYERPTSKVYKDVDTREKILADMYSNFWDKVQKGIEAKVAYEEVVNEQLDVDLSQSIENKTMPFFNSEAEAEASGYKGVVNINGKLARID